MTPPTPGSILSSLWTFMEGPADALSSVALEGPAAGLPSVYPVAEAAIAQVAAATLAVAEVHAARTGSSMRRVHVDARHVVAAFRSERYLRAVGWDLPAVWDPIAGDYASDDTWIRLHTNYAYHRDAVLRVLEVPCEREAVASAVRNWKADALETAVVQAGGCAAVMRTSDAWQRHPQGMAVAGEPLVHRETGERAAPPARLAGLRDGDPPLARVRVLDLTRVIAGPVCTRVLAAYGADVVRVDPPGFREVGALLPDTTAGKRRVALDLHLVADRGAFEKLVEGAHVLVSGYRGDALDRLGYSARELHAKNPGIVLASLDAYGFSGPWRARRGFDSLVQMSCGIAARGAEAAGAKKPTPLPAQALDHGTGYLLAAAVCRALTRSIKRGEIAAVRLSLASTARWLTALGETGDPRGLEFTPADAAPWMESSDTAWGRIERVRCPGRIEGLTPAWRRPAGPLGTDTPVWSD
jgi:hypothetical protein